MLHDHEREGHTALLHSRGRVAVGEEFTKQFQTLLFRGSPVCCADMHVAHGLLDPTFLFCRKAHIPALLVAAFRHFSVLVG